jgi:hypothetical protein
MRIVASTLAALALVAARLPAQTADSIVARYIRGVGGMERIQAVTTLRTSGRMTAGGGVELIISQESKRPNRVRSEFTIQGMTGITAYDGQAGWKVMPFQGRKDPEPLGEDELRVMVEEADFDGPLVNYQQKGNHLELLGTDQVEGTDVYKLKVTLPNGDSQTYFLDTENCIPIKIETRRTIRGAEQATETILGNYRMVAGWLLPHSVETRRLGGTAGARVTIDSAAANVPIDDARFARPAAPAPQPAQPKPDGGN